MAGASGCRAVPSGCALGMVGVVPLRRLSRSECPRPPKRAREAASYGYATGSGGPSSSMPWARQSAGSWGGMTLAFVTSRSSADASRRGQANQSGVENSGNWLTSTSPGLVWLGCASGRRWPGISPNWIRPRWRGAATAPHRVPERPGPAIAQQRAELRGNHALAAHVFELVAIMA
jgi:hypothetical protein